MKRHADPWRRFRRFKDVEGLLAGKPPLVRRIAVAVRRAVVRGALPELLYLSPDERRQLESLVPGLDADQARFGGMLVRTGKNSAVYANGRGPFPLPKHPPP